MVTQTYAWPYNAHTPIGPTCAVADVTPKRCGDLREHAGRYAIRAAGRAGCSGCRQNGARDVLREGSSSLRAATPYSDAAAGGGGDVAAVGTPVACSSCAGTSIGWDNYGPATLMDIRAGVDAKGNIVAFDYTHSIRSTWTARTRRRSSWPAMPSPASEHRAAASTSAPRRRMYNIPNSGTGKSLPLHEQLVQGCVDLRAPQAQQTAFAAEQMIDELAHAAKMDPVAFRVQNVARERPVAGSPDRWLRARRGHQGRQLAAEGRGVEPVGRQRRHRPRRSRGRPLGTAITSAAIADIEVNKKTGQDRRSSTSTVRSDAGLVDQPGLSRTRSSARGSQISKPALLEQVRSQKRGDEPDWVSYPILRFKDAPQVTPHRAATRRAAAGVGEPVRTAAPQRSRTRSSTRRASGSAKRR